MHPAATRLVLEGALIVGALFAVSQFVHRPLAIELASARAELAGELGEIEQTEAALAGRVDPAARLEAARARALALTALSGSATDPGALYDALVSAAERHRVELSRIDPRRDARAPTSRDGRELLGVTAYSISLGGEYADVVSFVRELEERFPLTIISAIRFTQGDDPARPERVLATLETAHYALREDPMRAKEEPS